MTQQSINIINFKTLYEILNEIKENFSFKVINYHDEKIFFQSLENKDLNISESIILVHPTNKKMLDIYIKFAEGSASSDELELANSQLRQILKNLGLGILLILPFSPITLPYIFTKAKELEIDLIPNWYKSLSNDDDRLE